jgi:hypothetical protein
MVYKYMFEMKREKTISGRRKISELDCANAREEKKSVKNEGIKEEPVE